MRLLYLLSAALCLTEASAAVVGSLHKPLKSCKNPPQRKEWRQLTLLERKSYLDAVSCLTKKEAKSGIEGTVNRFDDHQAVHMVQKPQIHWVGHFILWHRYFVATYEKALRDECGYTGGQPYWNWSLDAEPQNENSTQAFESEIFDPETGFGGNGYPVAATPEQNRFNLTGRTGGGCVMNGPFTPDRFYLNLPTPHCLTRDFIPWILNRMADQRLVDEVLAQPDYTSVARTIEKERSFSPSNVHASGHFGVGGVLGTMGNAAESPGDPIFYLHHGNLDHIFWQWQQRDLKTRLNQVGGPIEPFDYSGKNVTLDFEINIGALADNATLKDLLNIEGGTLCYTY